MATNADIEAEGEIITPDAEEDLRKAKEESESNAETEKPKLSEEDAQSEESQEESKDDSTLTTQPSESEHDLAWYKKAYEESTSEGLRLKKERDDLKASPPPPVLDSQENKTNDVVLTPEQLYIKQKQDEEIATAFTDVTEKYPQVKDPEEYKRFTMMANTFGKTILDAEKRLATPAELYSKTIIALGWTADDNQEKLGAALKDSAGSPKISSGSPASVPNSKVTDQMIAANRKMYPNKTDAEIREELEPHVQ